MLDGVFAPEREGEVVDDRAHLPALDGLRGVAVLLVVMLHLTMQIHNPSGVGTFLLKRVFFFGCQSVYELRDAGARIVHGNISPSRWACNWLSNAALFVTAALGICFNILMQFLLGRLVPWAPKIEAA